MNRAERRLHRAIRITPPGDRERYADEWRGDLAAAEELGLSPADVARGASRVAWHLRARYSVRTLAGAEGGGKATVAWAAMVLSVPVVLLLIGGIGMLAIPAVMVAAVIVAARSAKPTRAIFIAVTGSLWLACTVLYFWVETSPASRDVGPAWLQFGSRWVGLDLFWLRIGPIWLSDGLVWLGVLSFIAFWFLFGIGVAHNSPRRAHRPEPAHPEPADD